MLPLEQRELALLLHLEQSEELALERLPLPIVRVADLLLEAVVVDHRDLCVVGLDRELCHDRSSCTFLMPCLPPHF